MFTWRYDKLVPAARQETRCSSYGECQTLTNPGGVDLTQEFLDACAAAGVTPTPDNVVSETHGPDETPTGEQIVARYSGTEVMQNPPGATCGRETATPGAPYPPIGGYHFGWRKDDAAPDNEGFSHFAAACGHPGGWAVCTMNLSPDPRRVVGTVVVL